MLSKEENKNKIDLKLKIKDTIEKAKKIRASHRGDACQCSLEASLAYDMQYVERYIEKLEYDFEQIQHEHDRLDKRNNELIEQIKEKDKIIEGLYSLLDEEM